MATACEEGGKRGGAGPDSTIRQRCGWAESVVHWTQPGVWEVVAGSKCVLVLVVCEGGRSELQWDGHHAV